MEIVRRTPVLQVLIAGWDASRWSVCPAALGASGCRDIGMCAICEKRLHIQTFDGVPTDHIGNG